MSDEQLQQVLDRFQPAGETDGREYRAGRGDGVSEEGDRAVNGRAGPAIAPPVNEDTTVTLDHFTDEGRVLYQREFEQATIFYSALERAAEAVKTERAPAQQWIATLKNAPGVKAEELEWTGIIDWLEAQTGQVDKSQVVETIRRGGIVVREIDLTADPDENSIMEAQEIIEDELRNDFALEYEGPYRVNEYDEEVEDGEEGEARTFFTVESDNGEYFEFDTEEEAQAKADELNAEAESVAFYDWLEYQDIYSEAVERARQSGHPRQGRACLRASEEPLWPVHPHHRHCQRAGQTHAGQPRLQLRPSDLPRTVRSHGIGASEIRRRG